MTPEQILSVLSIVIAILTVFITVAGIYLTYISTKLEGKINDRLDRQFEKLSETLTFSFNTRVNLIEIALEVLTDIDETMSADDRRSRAYFVHNLSRLLSSEPDEVKKAILAIEGAGTAVYPFLAHVERIKNTSHWSPECLSIYEKLVRRLRAKP